MQITTLTPDAHVAVGQTYAANAAVLFRGDDALLIDAMGSAADAVALHEWINNLGKRVRLIISSHYFSDHIAALRLFPEAEIIAHELYLHTWNTERFRSAEEVAHFVPPTMTFEGGMTIRWGAHTLELFHNPGHTMSTIGIDIPTLDLLHVGDTIVGNMGYIAYSAMGLLAEAIERARRRGRNVVVSSHGGPRSAVALTHAATYLRNLAQKSESAAADDIRRIAIDDCLPPGITGSKFETVFHLRNLDTLVERARGAA